MKTNRRVINKVIFTKVKEENQKLSRYFINPFCRKYFQDDMLTMIHFLKLTNFDLDNIKQKLAKSLDIYNIAT